MDAEGLWFSKIEREYSADLGEFRWTEEQRTWDWRDLTTVELVRTKDGKKKLILRRRGEVQTRYGRPDKIDSDGGPFDATLRYMLGIDIDKGIGKIETDYYTAKVRDHVKDRWIMIGPKMRWSFQIGEDAWIWQWAEEGPGSSGGHQKAPIGEVYKYIKDILEAGELVYTNKFNLNVGQNDECSPVIYQPAVDGMKNFIREIHCFKRPPTEEGMEMEVTLVFNNEELRKHRVLNKIYERVRLAKYGRLKDIESFVIMADSPDEKARGLRFTKIYSGHHNLEEDTIHGDSEPDLPPHRVRYYADEYRHPIIFVNTSNHAMAEHDTNPDLWKWEYVPWVEDRPFVSDKMSRKEVDRPYRSSLERTFEGLTRRLMNLSG